MIGNIICFNIFVNILGIDPLPSIYSIHNHNTLKSKSNFSLFITYELLNTNSWSAEKVSIWDFPCQ